MKQFLCVTILVAFACPAFADSTSEYREFGREVKQIIEKMKPVATGTREKSDLRTLEFLLRDYNRAVHEKNWRQADNIRDKMSVSLARGGVVAGSAAKRIADKKRADDERRHKEVMEELKWQSDMARLRAQRPIIIYSPPRATRRSGFSF